jgi:hypothetical protein
VCRTESGALHHRRAAGRMDVFWVSDELAGRKEGLHMVDRVLEGDCHGDVGEVVTRTP